MSRIPAMATAMAMQEDPMRAYRACLHCRGRKTKCNLEANGGRPVGFGDSLSRGLEWEAVSLGGGRGGEGRGVLGGTLVLWRRVGEVDWGYAPFICTPCR